MNARTKVFIVDRDCASLVSLMLWLDQYPEFEVAGTTADATALLDQVKRANADVVLVDLAGTADANQTVSQTMLSMTSLIKAIKSASNQSSVLLRTQNDQENSFAFEADGSVGPKSSVKELLEVIRKTANKRRVALSAANMPMTKAG